MEEPTTGKCHCGAVEYAVTADPSFSFLCHCDNCRILNGGARLYGVTFAASEFSVTKGKPSTYNYPGGKGQIESHFCADCATPLYAVTSIFPDAVIVRGGSLVDQNKSPPQKAIYSHQACAWEKTS